MYKYCEGCLLEGKSEPQNPKGPRNARFFVVTGTPSHKPESYGRLMNQLGMHVFKRAVESEEFSRDDFYFCPSVRCPHDPDKFTKKERTAIRKQCRAYFEDEVKRAKPKVIIPLGVEAAEQVAGRAVKITKVRGIPEHSSEFGALVLPMLNPLQVALYQQHEPIFKSDVATLGRLVDHDYDFVKASKSSVGDYEFVYDLQFLIDADPEVVAFDTENTTLRWFNEGAKILTMQFSIEEGKAYMLPWDHPDDPRTGREKARLKKQLRELLCKPGRVVVGQNLKYDTTYLLAKTGIRIEIGGDTILLASEIDENALTKNLDDLVKRYVPAMAGYADRFNATVDKSRMIELPLDDNFLEYGCGDADATLRLYHQLYPMVSDDARLLAHYEHVMLAGINAFASMEMRGLHVNEDVVDEFEQVTEADVEERYRELLKQVPRSIKRKHVEKGLKFSRKDFLLDILFYHPDGFKLKPKVFTKTTQKFDDPDRKVPSTSTKDHLPYFYDTCPFTLELAEYIKMERLLGTNVKGFKKKYIIDGLVRPSYALHIAVTGRTSSEDPNGQNFPKRGPVATAYRRIYVAPDDCYVLEADLSQAELRIAGDMANDPVMIDIYKRAGDIHTETALIVMGISMEEFKKLTKDEQKVARTKAKAVNFGFLYGMGWRKFIGYAKTQYGVEFTDKEAQRIRIGFFEKYPKLQDWHMAVRGFVRINKYVRSYSGRIRHLPMIDSKDEGIQSEAERQAINSPVQGFGSDLGVMAIGRLDKEIDPQYLQVVGFVHDAIYCYVPKRYLEWGARTLKWYMESNPLKEWFNLTMKLPIVADVSFGTNFSDSVEFKGLESIKSYRFGKCDHDFEQYVDKEGKPLLYVPKQSIPPNYGRL